MHDVPSARIVCIELRNAVQHLLLRCIRRKVNADRLDAYLVAIAMLARDVRVAPRVIPDEDGAEPGNDARPTQCIDSGSKLILDLGCYSLAIEDRCRHDRKYSARPGDAAQRVSRWGSEVRPR